MNQNPKTPFTISRERGFFIIVPRINAPVAMTASGSLFSKRAYGIAAFFTVKAEAAVGHLR